MEQQLPKYIDPRVTTWDTDTPQSSNEGWINIDPELSGNSSSGNSIYITPRESLGESPPGTVVSVSHQITTCLASNSNPAFSPSNVQRKTPISSTCTGRGEYEQSKSKGRKGHTKSRRGCYNCKKARIKVFILFKVSVFFKSRLSPSIAIQKKKL